MRGLTNHLPVRPLERSPSVSVVVPCYNYGHYLPQAISSILGQPGVELEVVIIDDASTDDSARVAQVIAASDPRVRAICHAENQGHIRTYNEGLFQVDGEYLVLLSADDMLADGALERATALLDRHPTVGFVYGHPPLFEDEPPAAVSEVRSWSVWSGQDWIGRRAKRGDNVIMSPEVVIRRSIQHAIGGYDPRLPHAGDLEMWLRAAAVADVGRVNGATQAYYRIHDKSMQRTTYASRLADMDQRREAFEVALTGAASRIPDGRRLYAGACRAIAAESLRAACRAYDEGDTDTEPVEAYVEFARRISPDAERLSAWRALQRRRREGPERTQRGPRTAGRRFARRVDHHLRWRYWRRVGA